MYFYIVSYNRKDETTSSYFNVVELLLKDTTRISHECGKKLSKLMHLYSLEILILTNKN
jgi:hypothetical protein